MSDEITYRFYKDGDEHQILQLLTKVFPKWGSFKNPEQLYHWKYLEPPLKVLINLACHGTQIIGCNHSLVYEAKIDDEITSLHYGDDLAVDPEYRGRGVWKGIRDNKNTVYPLFSKYNYSTTTSEKVLESWKRRNRKTLPIPVTRLIKTRDIDQQLKNRPRTNPTLIKIGYKGLETLNQIGNVFKQRPEIKTGFKVDQITRFDSRVNMFWEKIQKNYKIIIKMTPEYLNWRYKDTERGSHKIYVAMEEERILGFSAVEYQKDSGEGQIIDLIALKDRLDVADLLFERANTCLKDQGVHTIFYQTVKNHPYHDLAKLHGFINSGSQPTIEFDYSDSWKQHYEPDDIEFLREIEPSQVYFNYSTTV